MRFTPKTARTAPTASRSYVNGNTIDKLACLHGGANRM
jgi:hypothetical protein